MGHTDVRQDAVVIGGGFYGTAIAVYLAKHRHLERVLLLEREPALLTRASYNNQARVHNGYHYPRSFTTAHRSRVNLPSFVRDWPDAVEQSFTSLYAIARRNSKVTAKQFERFCAQIGAVLAPAGSETKSIFEPKLIEEVYVVQEYSFDATKLAARAEYELRESGVAVWVNSHVRTLWIEKPGELRLGVSPNGDDEQIVSSRYVFNCTYSGLNQFEGGFPGLRREMKHELAEMVLMEVPPALDSLAVTVMDGPFFSLMPFPSRGLHCLSHVRYTPHSFWKDEAGLDPYSVLAAHDRKSRADRMIRDASRYLPAIADVVPIESIFEIKTVLSQNEVDDGRPILFEAYKELPGCYSILGGKIDNIYDVIEKLDAECIFER